MATPRTTHVYDITRVPLLLPPYGDFNTELAEAVYKAVEDNYFLWDQGCWRIVLDPDTMDLEQADQILAITAPADSRCGTAMCYAGWAAEVSGVDWAVDREAIAAGQYGGTELVLVANGAPWTDTEPRHVPPWSVLSTPTRRMLKARGFTSSTHLLVSIEAFANRALGLVEGDWRGLFESDNDLDMIRQVLDDYESQGVLRPYRDGDGILVDEITVEFAGQHTNVRLGDRIHADYSAASTFYGPHYGQVVLDEIRDFSR